MDKLETRLYGLEFEFIGNDYRETWLARAGNLDITIEREQPGHINPWVDWDGELPFLAAMEQSISPATALYGGAGIDAMLPSYGDDPEFWEANKVALRDAFGYEEIRHDNAYGYDSDLEAMADEAVADWATMVPKPDYQFPIHKKIVLDTLEAICKARGLQYRRFKVNTDRSGPWYEGIFVITPQWLAFTGLDKAGTLHPDAEFEAAERLFSDWVNNEHYSYRIESNDGGGIDYSGGTYFGAENHPGGWPVITDGIEENLLNAINEAMRASKEEAAPLKEEKALIVEDLATLEGQRLRDNGSILAVARKRLKDIDSKLAELKASRKPLKAVIQAYQETASINAARNKEGG